MRVPRIILEETFKSEDTNARKLLIRNYFIKQIENMRKWEETGGLGIYSHTPAK